MSKLNVNKKCENVKKKKCEKNNVSYTVVMLILLNDEFS